MDRLAPEALDAIVSEVISRLGGGGSSGSTAGTSSSGSTARLPGMFADLDAALEAAAIAQRGWVESTLEQRRDWIEVMRRTARGEAEVVARMAVEETGLGRADDKVRKNRLVADKTPGLEDLDPRAVTGDHGLTLEELAPWGVIGAIAPCTNPTETIVCNGIGMAAAGNAVVFCPHPLAKRTSAHMIAAVNSALVAAGAPANLWVGLSEPTIELAQALMRHPKAPLIVVTGGPDVVREAMRSGKPVIGAGPGNPPALVDETADLETAGREIVLGASLDNNIICTDEKEVICVASAADRLKAALEAGGAKELHGEQITRLMSLILQEPRGREARVRKEWIGKDATRLLEALGVKAAASTRLILCEVDPDHPFVWTELLMPVLPLVRRKTFEEAMELAVAAEKGCRHTATMWSRDVTRLSRVARAIDTSIFVKNGPAYAGLGMGGEGATSFTIAGPTGQGMTSARHFARRRRCALVDAFRIV